MARKCKGRGFIAGLVLLAISGPVAYPFVMFEHVQGPYTKFCLFASERYQRKEFCDDVYLRNSIIPFVDWRTKQWWWA